MRKIRNVVWAIYTKFTLQWKIHCWTRDHFYKFSMKCILWCLCWGPANTNICPFLFFLSLTTFAQKYSLINYYNVPNQTKDSFKVYSVKCLLHHIECWIILLVNGCESSIVNILCSLIFSDVRCSIAYTHFSAWDIPSLLPNLTLRHLINKDE